MTARWGRDSREKRDLVLLTLVPVVSGYLYSLLLGVPILTTVLISRHHYLQHAGDGLGIAHVHLAAQRDDVIGAARARQIARQAHIRPLSLDLFTRQNRFFLHRSFLIALAIASPWTANSAPRRARWYRRVPRTFRPPGRGLLGTQERPKASTDRRPQNLL